MNRTRLAALVVFTLLCLQYPARLFAQSANLEDVSDIISDQTEGATTEHTISFKLPVGASPIRTTDYIRLELPGIADLTPPTYITGPHGGGTPVYTVGTEVITITNITVASGYSIVVRGITGRNAGGYEADYTTTVKITTDAAGLIVKNQHTVYVTVQSAFHGRIDITALIDTPESRLSIAGFTAPETYINFAEAGSIIGTDLSGLDGHFGKVFSGIVPATHTVTFFGIDKLRLTTSPIITSVYTPPFALTSVTNQLLSPTLTIDKTSFNQGESVVATGTAIPNGNITLFTESPLRVYTATASAIGDWTYTITNTDTYILGDYQIRALVQNGTGLTSLTSPASGFTVTSTASSSGTACGEIANGDLNCDLSIDLTDFSILMYWWGTNNASADINADLLVNLTDFSVMMYWWGT